MHKLYIYTLIIFLFTACFEEKEDSVSFYEDGLEMEITGTKYFYKGVAFYSDDNSQKIYNTHASWTHSNVFYDPSIEKTIIFYNIKPFHDIYNSSVAFRFQDNQGYSSVIPIADGIASGISYKCQSSGISKNGDYIALISYYNKSIGGEWRTLVFRSKDKGSTWTSAELNVDNIALESFAGDVTGFLVLENGRIITLACDPKTRKTRIIYSDDNGVTWNFSKIPDCYYHTEPGWCELSDGTIICYLRETVGGPHQFSSARPAYFTRSFDSGLTWELPKASNSIKDMTEANGHLLYYKAKQAVEFIHHSRYAQRDNYSSIYISVASEEDAKNDRMNPPIRFVRLPNQSKGGDSGYIGACFSGKSFVNVFYYSGTNLDADIYSIVGYRRKSN